MSIPKNVTQRVSSVVLRLLLIFPLSAAYSIAIAGTPEGSRHIVPKQAAILGTTATWAYVLVSGTSVTNCKPKGLNLRVEHGVDAELSISSLGGFTHECLLKDWSGLRLSYTPILNFTHWAGDSTSQFSRSSYDVAFVPMLRFEPKISWLSMPLDFEIGVGPALMEKTSIGNREKTTNFQFSDHFGIGISGSDRSWRLGFAFRHLSNLNLGNPNNGVNFFGASFEMTLK